MRSGDGSILSSLDMTSRTTMSARTEGSRSQAKDTHYVGFANFPNQVFRRAIKNGFEFTLMVVGQSGLGKSTFVNTLFLAEINDPKQINIPKVSSTTSIEQKHVKLVENGTTLRLSLVDTPGFGDAIDNNKCWEPIVQFIEKRYLDYFTEETKIERKERVTDHCVHLCFYFIAPTGHGLKQLDIECMKRLHEHVNIIPVIAKADCLTKDELARFKAQIQKDIDTNGIKVYKFPESEDEDEKKQLEPLRRRVPFAVVGSNQLKEDGGRKYRYREYAWGVVEVDNLAHNDFIALRDMVIRTNLVDLIEVTRNVHYENFRFRQMQGKGGAVQKNGSGDRDPFTQMEEDHHRREKEFMAKQREMDKLFEDKVADRNKRFAERTARLDSRDHELKRLIEDRKNEIDRLMNESDGSSTAPRVSRANSKVSELSLHNENGLKLSPPGGEKPQSKVKKAALGIFTRNS